MLHQLYHAIVFLLFFFFEFLILPSLTKKKVSRRLGRQVYEQPRRVMRQAYQSIQLELIILNEKQKKIQLFFSKKISSTSFFELLLLLM